MAIPRIPEKAACKILAICNAVNVQAGHVIMARYLDTKFLTSGGSADELKAGLLYAHQKGWLDVQSGGATVYLTQAGFDAMRGSQDP